jgi:hypothetical protein
MGESLRVGVRLALEPLLIEQQGLQRSRLIMTTSLPRLQPML